MGDITANHITHLLSCKHLEDVFVSECKNGPSGKGLLRMDGWAMKKSWSNPHTYGYEIKVSRSDFLGDNKWQGYLTYCNFFHFVCPSGLIQPDELPKDVGLMYVSKSGNKLFTKKKAVWRDVEIPEELWRYVLMARTKITKPDFYMFSCDYTTAMRLKQWLDDDEANKKLAFEVNGKIKTVVENVYKDNNHLKQQMKNYDVIKQRITEMGFDVNEHVSTWSVDDKLKKMKGSIPRHIWRNVDQTIQVLEKLKEEFQEKEKSRCLEDL